MNRYAAMKVGLVVLVTTIALVATVALNGPASVTADGSAVAPEIEGTWLATVTVADGPPPFPSLVSYARGGVLTVTDSSMAPGLGNIYQGAWTKTGPRQYAFAFLGFQYDASGFAGYIRAHETVTLQPDGNTYDGVTMLEFLDTEQKILGTASSSSHAVRVNAQ